MYFKNKYNLRIGESTAERLKMIHGTVSEKYNGKAVTVQGLDVQNGLPRQLILTNSFFIEALKEVIDTIISAIMTTLENLPAELVNDLVDRGIILTGGGAMELANHLQPLIIGNVIPVKHNVDLRLSNVEGYLKYGRFLWGNSAPKPTEKGK